MHIFDITLFGLHIAPTYYGLMYAIGFLVGYALLSRRARPSISYDQLLIVVVLGVVVGGRLGYVIFYDPSYYLAHPAEIPQTWHGGMSFHGGIIGVIVALIIYARRTGVSFLALADDIASVVPIGLGLGRIGNYLNKELLGFTPYHGYFAVEK